jgi:hypothetical protein
VVGVVEKNLQNCGEPEEVGIQFQGKKREKKEKRRKKEAEFEAQASWLAMNGSMSYRDQPSH